VPIPPCIECANTNKEADEKIQVETILTNTYWSIEAGIIHNHPITSAHALSYWDVLEETKHALYSLFEIGHSPSSARHAREQALYIQAESEAEAQFRLADHAHNPLIQDICRLFIKWREAPYGKDNGEGFEKLQEKVDRYNSDASAAEGKVILQWHQTPATEYSEHESESETIKPTTYKT